MRQEPSAMIFDGLALILNKKEEKPMKDVPIIFVGMLVVMLTIFLLVVLSGYKDLFTIDWLR